LRGTERAGGMPVIAFARMYRGIGQDPSAKGETGVKFIDSDKAFPISSAVVHGGKTFEAVVTGIPDGESKPVPGGAAAEMREAFRQLDLLLAEAGIDRFAICTARLYLQDVRGEIGEVNEVYKEYFAGHPVVRRAYGVELQAGMRIEAAFTAEVP